MMCTTNNTTFEYTPDVYNDAMKALFPPKPSFMAFTITREG